MVQRLTNDVYVADMVLVPADFLRELVAAYRRRAEIRRPRVGDGGRLGMGQPGHMGQARLSWMSRPSRSSRVVSPAPSVKHEPRTGRRDGYEEVPCAGISDGAKRPGKRREKGLRRERKRLGGRHPGGSLSVGTLPRPNAAQAPASFTMPRCANRSPRGFRWPSSESRARRCRRG